MVSGLHGVLVDVFSDNFLPLTFSNFSHTFHSLSHHVDHKTFAT